MRIGSIFIHGVVIIVLSIIAFYAGCCCCRFNVELTSNCNLAAVGGISSFAEISFALNTSIAIDWVKKQFVAWFDRFAKKSMIKMRVKNSQAKLSDESTEKINELINTLKQRFESMMRLPSKIYTVLGGLFSFGIVVLLFLGIPCCLKRYIILLPFPAIAFYLTSFLVGFHIVESFDGSLHDNQDVSAEEDAENASSDADSIACSATKSRKRKSTSSRNGRAR